MKNIIGFWIFTYTFLQIYSQERPVQDWDRIKVALCSFSGVKDVEIEAYEEERDDQRHLYQYTMYFYYKGVVIKFSANIGLSSNKNVRRLPEMNTSSLTYSSFPPIKNNSGGRFHFERQNRLYFLKGNDLQLKVINFHNAWLGCVQQMCFIGTIDALAYCENLQTMIVFRGKHYWNFTLTKKGDPYSWHTMPISAQNIDAALCFDKNRIMVFKETMVKISGNELNLDDLSIVHNFEQELSVSYEYNKNRIDAAVIRNRDLLVFKGTKCTAFLNSTGENTESKIEKPVEAAYLQGQIMYVVRDWYVENMILKNDLTIEKHDSPLITVMDKFFNCHDNMYQELGWSGKQGYIDLIVKKIDNYIMIKKQFLVSITPEDPPVPYSYMKWLMISILMTLCILVSVAVVIGTKMYNNAHYMKLIWWTSTGTTTTKSDSVERKSVEKEVDGSKPKEKKHKKKKKANK